VKFNRGARLDTSQVGDRRGMGVAGIGGGLGIVGLIITLLLGGNPLSGDGSSGFSLDAPESNDLSAECRTGADAEQQTDCRIVAIVNSVQAFWAGEAQGYRQAKTNLFTGGVNTACGQASSAVGPFYCPADQGVYLDLSFFEDLQTRFGAEGGDFAEAYVIAHEYGHHVQHLLGLDEQVGNDRQGAESGGVRLELQADCFAGAWARGAEDDGFITEISDDDIAEGLDAAGVIGDDNIQRRSGGDVDPHGFTHGTSEQRQRWLTTGYNDGADACDTFAATEL
jgi:predicted metalloprotease